MKAIVIAVGDELLSGATVDTNSAYLAGELALRGIETIAHRTVGDNECAISSAIAAAAEQVRIVLVSGGLGPTKDDLTRQGLARAMGGQLVLNETCLAEIEAFFSRRGRQMAEVNRFQAMIPAGADPLPNAIGTAPGIAGPVGQAQVFVMPGVPVEMRQMFAASVSPRLGETGISITRRLLHTYGTGESDIGSMIADLMVERDGAVTVGTTVSGGLVSIRVTARGPDDGEVRAAADAVIAEVRRRLGTLVVGAGDVTMAPAVGQLLAGRRETLATAESCTGGMIGQMITDTPGASAYYVGGIVAYANEIKTAELGVGGRLLDDEGAVSERVAEAMALGCRRRFASDWAVSVTGIAGPAGGTEGKPVGLVYIALASASRCEVHRHVFPGPRRQVRQRTAIAALNHVRLALLEPEAQVSVRPY